MSNELTIHSAPVIPYSDMEKMAAVIAQSGLFSVKHPTQALALMLVAQSEGLHPASAARDYHVIQGRPALKTDAMLARFQAAGGRVQWHDYSDAVVSATFTHAAGGAVKIEWTMERARTAGLTNKEVWKQYPRAMLRARAISEGIRAVYPGVLSGMYAPEEVRDIAEPPVAEPPETPPRFDVDAADAAIASMTDVDALRTWLKATAREQGWQAGDARYEMLKSACAEHAARLKSIPTEESSHE